MFCMRLGVLLSQCVFDLGSLACVYDPPRYQYLPISSNSIRCVPHATNIFQYLPIVSAVSCSASTFPSHAAARDPPHTSSMRKHVCPLLAKNDHQQYPCVCFSVYCFDGQCDKGMNAQVRRGYFKVDLLVLCYL